MCVPGMLLRSVVLDVVATGRGALSPRATVVRMESYHGGGSVRLVITG